MFRSHLTIAAFAATLMLTGAAFAQSPYAQPPQQLYSQSTTLAQAPQEPSQRSQCGQDADSARHSAVLGVQQNTPGAEQRTIVMADLQTASAAAGTGDDAMCRFWLGHARQ